MTTKPNNGMVPFLSDCLRWSLTGGAGFKFYLAGLLAVMGAGGVAYLRQFQEGLITTGMSISSAGGCISPISPSSSESRRRR